MTDHSVYATTVTAIGYGISTPLDEAGVTAGTRRIKENIPLYCIPNDTTFANCFSDPMASQVLSADEFVSGDASTCEGDSGSGAYDQPSFNRGQWVAFGVLSRGAVSQDGKTCVQPVYSRFDAWGPLLIEAATEAATMGGYSAPVWAGGSGPATTTTPAVDAAAIDDAAGAVMTSRPAPGSLADGKACEADSDLRCPKLRVYRRRHVRLCQPLQRRGVHHGVRVRVRLLLRSQTRGGRAQRRRGRVGSRGHSRQGRLLGLVVPARR
jgi:hypothetical protein